MRLAWLSDVHLNFVRDPATGTLDDDYFTFIESVKAAAADGVVISGDIAEAPDLEEWLLRLGAGIPDIPIYFVLGNHDFYRGSIVRRREQIRIFCERNPRFCYLSSQAAPIPLSDQTMLIGHDGWADGRLGDFHRSTVNLADYSYIEELTGLTLDQRFATVNRLGDEAAAFLQQKLQEAGTARHVMVVTHVPPFWGACLYRGQPSSPEWVPHFGCEALGTVLIAAANERPAQQITVLCGHTHFPATYRPKPNLTVWTAQADYGTPELQRMIECE